MAGWLMRGTLHLVTREDYGWLHPIFAPRLVPRTLGRLRRLGVTDPDPLVDAVAASLPATRAEIAELTGLSGQAVPHLIALTAHRGRLLVAGEHVYAPASVEGRPAVHHERDLARRYLRAHAPATPEDFAAWAGLPLGTARAAIQNETQVPGTPVSNENQVTGTSVSLPARLLGPFDPWLLGWRDRGFAVPEGMRRHVHPGGGMLRAVATVDGVVTATWSMPGGEPVLEPPDERFAAEAADVRRFFAASG